MLSSLSSTIRTVLAISALRLPHLATLWPQASPRPRRANGQNLSKTLVAIRYGKANGDGEITAYHSQTRRKTCDSGAWLHGRGARAPGSISRRYRYWA